MRRLALAALLLAAAPPTPALRPPDGSPAGPALPASALAVATADGWRGWWRAAEAPARWPAAHPAVAGAVRWRAAAPGVEWGELRLAGRGEAWRVRVVVARVDPARVRLALARRARDDGRPAWTVDSAADALLAANAGQFADDEPWGWLVADGEERRPPAYGPLAAALVVDTAGRARVVAMDSIPAVRARGGVALAVQSFPAVLVDDGVVPLQLRAAGRGVDVAHRDARLAVAELRDGRLLLALTRFEGLGGALDALPFGLTTPETAALLGALGARRAVLLDGGLSAQLLVRDGGAARRWPGLRRVPLGLVVRPRD